MGARKASASRSGARKGASPAAEAQEAGRLVAALIDVAADYYWEQDAEHRFTVWRSTGGERSGAVAADDLLGKTSAELCAAPGDDADHWVRHRAVLEAREPFRDVGHTLAVRIGPAQQLNLSGTPAYAANGDFVGYRGVARESGALARLERLLGLEGALLRGLAEADDLASALPLVVGLTCDFARFRCGCYFSVDEQSRALRRVVTHGATGAGRSVLVEGEAAPGWLAADPVWLADAGEARDGAWSSMLVVPVAVGGAMIGALEFCAAETTSPSGDYPGASPAGTTRGVPRRRVPARAARRHRAARALARACRCRRAAARKRKPVRVDDGVGGDRHLARRRLGPVPLRESAALRDARLHRARAARAHRQGHLPSRRPRHDARVGRPAAARYDPVVQEPRSATYARTAPSCGPVSPSR